MTTTRPLTPEQHSAIARLVDATHDQLDDLVEYDAHLDDEEQQEQFDDQSEAIIVEFVRALTGHDISAPE